MTFVNYYKDEDRVMADVFMLTALDIPAVRAAFDQLVDDIADYDDVGPSMIRRLEVDYRCFVGAFCRVPVNREAVHRVAGALCALAVEEARQRRLAEGGVS